MKQAGLLLADISRPCDQSTIVQSEVLVLSVLRFEVILSAYGMLHQAYIDFFQILG